MTEISKTAKDQISYLEGEGVDIRYDWVDNEIAIRPYWFILNRGSYIEIDEKELGELYSSFNSIGELAITYWAIGRLRMLPSIPILQELDWNCIVNPRNLSPNPIDKYFRNHSILSFQKGLGFITGYSKFSGWKIRNTERLDKKNYNPNHNHRLLSATMDGFLHIPVFNVEDEYMPNWAKSRAEVIVKKENGKWVFVKNSINAIIDLENLDELLLQ